MNYKFSSVNSLVKRLDFSKLPVPLFERPNLKGIQIDSYNDFLKNKIKGIIASYFPIVSNSGDTQIFLEDVYITPPTITEWEAIERSKSFQNDIYIKVKLINKQANGTDKVSEGKVFIGNMPEFSSGANFIINGIEKFIIAQIVRSPGLYILSKSQIKLSNSRKRTQEGIIGELLPLKGILILFHLPNGKNQIKLIARSNTGDSAPQFSATVLLKVLGFKRNQILSIFKNDPIIEETLGQDVFDEKNIIHEKSFHQIMQIISTTKNLQKLQESVKNNVQHTLYECAIEYYEKHGEKTTVLLNKLEVFAADGNKTDYELTAEELQKEVKVASNLLEKMSVELAAKHIVSELGINSDSKAGIVSYQNLIQSYLFEKNYYDMLDAGRYKLNHKLSVSNRIYKKIIAQDILDTAGKIVFAKDTYMGLEKINEFNELSKQGKLAITKKLNLSVISDLSTIADKFKEVVWEEVDVYISSVGSSVVSLICVPNYDDDQTIMPSDFIATLSYMMNMKHRIGDYDDIDSFGNKRIRLISDLLENRIHLALSRVQKYSIEKMNNLEARISYFTLKNSSPDAFFTIHSVLNTKPFQIVVKEFFNSHQLTQFLDQQNPLSELTNKRKISAMGPGGIKREDPNLNIRDVHFTHYGRICPIETPEGMNIGLIMALAAYAKVDKYGFLSTPYYKINNSKVTDEVVWLNALEETNYVIVEATTPVDKNKNLISPVIARSGETVEKVDSSAVDLIDISCDQLVSISASLIPFLEHDDANRVLMGANMQRQAVPLLKPYSPIVGTGSENKIAEDSSIAILAKEDGVVEKSDGKILTIHYEKKDKKEKFNLLKFVRSNQNTCKNQSPLVRPGDKVKKGQMLVNGHAMQNGELAIGQNLLVAFTTWHGYNYEDAIILSSRLFQQDIYTSVHVQEHVIECLRTKIGDEEITRQIPNCTLEQKKYLDEDGLIIVGAKVKEGDILVGKISPKANNDQTPEEKLLQAIFSEKARTVRDNSLRVPTGGDGIVSKVLRFSIYKGDKLNDDVIEVVKVFITQKRKIQVGDKMAGRHGNKGIVSRIVPVEDMPYLENGKPVDILLNPLGVPSRMNIGQVFETYLGFAARSIVLKKLIDLYFSKDNVEASKVFGLSEADIEKLFAVVKRYFDLRDLKDLSTAQTELTQVDLSIILSQAGISENDIDIKVCTPIFSGCKHEDLVQIMKDGGIDAFDNGGKLTVYDGRTGEKFIKPLAVGVMYMLKLDHMVDDKIYARSVGPYSQITQQPLGGKCQNGGQRFGEMEVWAMEAYGAAYNLLELLTLKSDDIQSRSSIYYSIIKGQKLPSPSVPESFKLLIKKLQGVGLKVNVRYGNNKELISCNEFIEKELNRGIDYVYDNDYEENLKQTISKLELLNNSDLK